MQYIESAELVRYNANSSGRKTGDCVKRAISLAFDLTYNEVAKLLINKMKSTRGQDKWNVRPVFEAVIKDLAPNAKHYVAEEAKKLTDFVDEDVDPNKVYLILTGKKLGQTDHLVCVRDKKIWDSWNSANEIVNDWYELTRTSTKQFTDIKDHMKELATYVMQDIVNNEIVNYMVKRKWSYGPIDIEMYIKEYQLIADAAICLEKNDWINKRRYYNFRIVVPLAPTMTVEDATEFIKKMAKQRTYDKMYTIDTEEKRLKEQEEIKKEMDYEGYEPYRNDIYSYRTPQEEKFLHSLPAWVSPLVEYIDIQNPGQYSDSYRVKIKPLPKDPRHTKDSVLWFEGYQAYQVRDMLKRYKDTFEVPGEDYDWHEEY